MQGEWAVLKLSRICRWWFTLPQRRRRLRSLNQRPETGYRATGYKIRFLNWYVLFFNKCKIYFLFSYYHALCFGYGWILIMIRTGCKMASIVNILAHLPYIICVILWENCPMFTIVYLKLETFESSWTYFQEFNRLEWV